jgi:DNA-binding NarL/FixJ family response regulator
MDEARSIRILVLEDHRIVGDGVAAAIEAVGGSTSLGVVTSVVALQAWLAARPSPEWPDVLVADLDLDGEFAFGVPALLGPTGPRVVFLTAHEEPSLVHAAVESGASAFVHKREPTERLVDAIRRAYAGETTFSVADLRTSRNAAPSPTDRERQVLRGIVRGHANKEIAMQLGVRERTVESHVRRMMDRYGVANRTELAVLALREGWIDVGG